MVSLCVGVNDQPPISSRLPGMVMLVRFSLFQKTLGAIFFRLFGNTSSVRLPQYEKQLTRRAVRPSENAAC